MQVAVRRGSGLQDCASAVGGDRRERAVAVVPEDGRHRNHRRCCAAGRRESCLRPLGLDGLRKPVNAGLRALLANCDLDGSRPLSAGDIAFRVAPRLNAAGRMDVAERVIRLFTEKDAAKAAEMAMELNQLNGDRQQAEQRIIEEIHARIEASPELKDAYCLVVEGEGWHRGVIGICASRVVERWRRPTLVFSCENGEAHGSGRSIPALFIFCEALESCPELFDRFGGHAHAVGCALPAERIAGAAFPAGCLCPAVSDARGLRPCAGIRRRDLLDEITIDFWLALQKLEPFGAGNPAAGVCGQKCQAGATRAHAEGEAHQAASGARRYGAPNGGRFQRAQEVLGWRMAERVAQEPLLVGRYLDLAFTLDYNSASRLRRGAAQSAGLHARRGRSGRRRDEALIDGGTTLQASYSGVVFPIRWRQCWIRSVLVAEMPVFHTADTACSVGTCSRSRKLRTWCLPTLRIRSITPEPARWRPSSTEVSGGASGPEPSTSRWRPLAALLAHLLRD